MIISQANWKKYVQQLSSISKTAGNQLQDWINKNGIGDMVALINYAIALSDKYGEAGASLAAQMYDEVAQLSGASVPIAEVAPTATYGEVAKAMYGTIKQNQQPSATMERLVKQASADTMRKNAIRDGAEWAWVPSGDSCAFCMTLASRGWQKASKKTLKGDHCDHIHAHCDCQFMIRFNSYTNVEGYNPQEYRRIYDNADGRKPKDKINAIRRMQYQKEKSIVFSNDNIDLNKEYIARSIGAKSSNADILDLVTGERYHLVEGTYLQNKEVFAGKGTKTQFRKAYKFANLYGGTIEDWQHVKGIGTVQNDRKVAKAEIHWAQCEGVGKVDMFIKEWLDES